MALTFSFIAKEVIKPGTPIYVYTPHHTVDAQSAHQGIHVYIGPKLVPVRFDVGSNAIKISTDGLAPAAYRVCVDRLLDNGGKYINTHRMTRMIRIRPIVGTVPSEERVERIVHLAVGDLSTTTLRPGQSAPDGTTYVEIMKVTHRHTHVPRRIAFDAHGLSVDGDEMLRAVAQRRRAKFGRIDETLWHQLEASAGDDTIGVIVWPKLDHDYCDYDKSKLEACRDRALSSFRRPKSRVLTLLQSFAADIDHDPEMPRMSARLSCDRVRQLATDEHVAMIFPEAGQPRVASWVASPLASLTTSLSVARAEYLQAVGGYDGDGVRVGVYEDGPSDLTDLVFAGRWQPDPVPVEGDAKYHSRMTSGIIKNTQPGQPHGFAPACSLYSANNYDPKALKWAIRDNNCTVISISFKYTPADLDPGQRDFDWLCDWYMTTPPYPTICTCAGNQDDTPVGQPPGWVDYVSAKYFNGLIVGSHDPSGTRMSVFSDYRIPASPHNDRELPDICGPGENVTVLGRTDNGTSFSTPATAGVVALIQGLDTRLQHSPEACRAIMYAAAGGRNIHPVNGFWWDEVRRHQDIGDGAGVLDASAATLIAQMFRQRSVPGDGGPNDTVTCGWSYGRVTAPFQFLPPDFHSPFFWRVRMPTTLEDPSATVFRVALAWNAKVTFTDDWQDTPAQTPSTLAANFDLVVLDDVKNEEVASSASFDNSYEIVDFEPVPGAVYRVVLRFASGADTTWYVVAWGLFRNGEILV